MARFDQGGGCACGLQRVCDCPSRSQADGRKTVKRPDGSFIIDRTDPEGGIPGRRMTLREYTARNKRCSKCQDPSDIDYPCTCPTMRATPQARGRARRKAHDEARTRERQAEILERARLEAAVAGLSPRAKKVWAKLKQGCWYTDPTPSVQELIDAGLVVLQGRVAVVRAAYVPVGTISLVSERIPENLP